MIFQFQISNSLLIVNSSANFVYYCLLAESFRKQIYNLFQRYCKCIRQYLPNQQPISQSSPYPKLQMEELPKQSLIQLNQENEMNLQVIVEPIPTMSDPNNYEHNGSANI